MSLDSDQGRAIHFPADPGKFSFDREVSAIFPDMAKRSIPNFEAAHAAHARMLTRWMKPGVRILDAGASRGAFIDAIRNEHEMQWASGDIHVDAWDYSPDMCGYLKLDFPGIGVRCMDLTSNEFLDAPQESYDVVCAHYVLQFLPPEKQYKALKKLLQMVKVGGVFILGHKSKHRGESGEAAHEEYIQFRVKNGYTREEIVAKTIALKGSMFPMDHAEVMNMIHANCHEVMETYRFMMFSTIFAVR